MCILCGIQKWSRRIAAMLPWLVIPLIGLWALSQFLPPSFRFEFTSPRLACVLVLLATLFWYEVLMPQLSAWRSSRSARLRERRRVEALEMQKLRKTATRRCRNCFTPYKDQKPGGGRFMCSYCGHISKRPVLEIPYPPLLTNHGANANLVGKSGKIWNHRSSYSRECVPIQACSVKGKWPAGSSNHCRRSGSGYLSGGGRCLTEKSYLNVIVFICNMLASFFLSIRWLWRRLFGKGSARQDVLPDNEYKRQLARGTDNGAHACESKGEKARRKAEEKRQARLEKELLEEEERKQREEVARLVEEQRRLRDEKLDAKRDVRKVPAEDDKERDIKRGTHKKKVEKKKEKDKWSLESNSDCEDVVTKIGKESEKKHEIDRKNETERQVDNITAENPRACNSAAGYVTKNATHISSKLTGGSSRYFDRVKRPFFSSSKALNGISFLGRGSPTSSTSTSKLNKAVGSGERLQPFHNRTDLPLGNQLVGRSASKRDNMGAETSIQQTVASSCVQTVPVLPKKTWQQLFIRSSSSDTSPVPEFNHIYPGGIKRSSMPSQGSPPQLENQICLGLPSSFIIPPLSSGLGNNSSVSSVKVSSSHLQGDIIPDESEPFEDPCCVTDPVALLGPVSKSLDNFSLDLGSGTDQELERFFCPRIVSTVAEAAKPSPIESPVSKLRVTEGRNDNSNRASGTPKSQSPHTPGMNESDSTSEPGTWKMWSSRPICQEELSLVHGPGNWLLSLGQGMQNEDASACPTTSPNSVMSEFADSHQIIPGVQPPLEASCIHDYQISGQCGPLYNGQDDIDMWLEKASYNSLSGDKESHILPSLSPAEAVSCEEVAYIDSSRQGYGRPFELSPGSSWSKEIWVPPSENVGSPVVEKPNVGGSFSITDVQSLW